MTKLSPAGKDTFETDANGEVTIDGLRNNDWENNEAVTDPGYYCLVEIKAPDGFELQTRPIAFQVLRVQLHQGQRVHPRDHGQGRPEATAASTCR